ncbi:MAG: ATP-binding protein [Rubrivivax sp.]
MRSLYLRIYLTVVAALALFALVSGWLLQHHLEQERRRFELSAQDRVAAWAELLQRSLPGPDAAPEDQAAALRDWSQRLRLPLALDNAQGQRIAASESYLRRERDGSVAARGTRVQLDDGRSLHLLRPLATRAGVIQRQPRDGAPGEWPGAGPGGPGLATPGLRLGDHPGGAANAGAGSGPDSGPGVGLPRDRTALGVPLQGGAEGPGLRAPEPAPTGFRLLPLGGSLTGPLPGPFPPGSLLDGGLGLALLLLVLFAAVALGAWPVVRRLTRRLEALKQGVEAFGAGRLNQRVAEDGRDEVAALGASFNQAAGRIEALLRSHQSLLANASHELRSPLARLKMAVSMAEDAAPEHREGLRQEINTNIGELDALVEEVLLASRLDATVARPPDETVELLALAAEEGARVDVPVEGQALNTQGEERLLRRALRNLLENARRYGGSEVSLQLRRDGAWACVDVLDRGAGVPEAFRERIFEPFFRLPGHAEREGGVGLGLALVRQIAQRHGGTVLCTPRGGGGTCFTLRLPAA